MCLVECTKLGSMYTNLCIGSTVLTIVFKHCAPSFPITRVTRGCVMTNDYPFSFKSVIRVSRRR